MLQKILKIIAVILLAASPFLCPVLMSKHSPYFEGNNFATYIIISLVYVVLSGLLLLWVVNKKLSGPVLLGGILLFLIGSVMASIFGLGAPPDNSLRMLKYPEREHYRYALLLVAALLFAISFFFIIRYKWHELPKWHKWIILLFIPAFAEMIWEFSHHYLYTENLKLWIDAGKKFEDFAKYYDSLTVIRFAAIGRCCQYAVIIWLSWILLHYSYVKKWTCIVIAIFCSVGFISGATILVIGFSLPASLQILMIFFIPGIPLVLLYWLSIALLGKTSTVQIK